jgi:transketolase C-terminal domain/subunit
VVGERLDRAIDQAREVISRTINPAGALLEAFGPRYIGPVNGHDIPHLVSILSDLRRQGGFTMLHVITQKGAGHPRAAQDPIGLHGVSPKVEPHAGPDLEFPTQGETTWSNIFADALIERAKRDDSVHAITAAMPDNTSVTKFAKQFPDRTHDVGICEQHAVAFASGLRKAGKKPVVAIFSTFLQRAYDELFQEVSLNHVPVTFCVDRAGVVGPDGATHNGSYDIAYLRSFPGIDLYSARDASEFRAMLDLALDGPNPAAIRYPRTFATHPARELPAAAPMVLGKAELLRDGTDTAILALGHLTYHALAAADLLAARGISAAVVNARFVRPLDLDMVRDLTERFDNVFTLEEHTIRGGFASHVLEELAMVRGRVDRIRPIALPDGFVPTAPARNSCVNSRSTPRGWRCASRPCSKADRSSSRCPLREAGREGRIAASWRDPPLRYGVSGAVRRSRPKTVRTTPSRDGVRRTFPLRRARRIPRASPLRRRGRPPRYRLERLGPPRRMGDEGPFEGRSPGTSAARRSLGFDGPSRRTPRRDDASMRRRRRLPRARVRGAGHARRACGDRRDGRDREAAGRRPLSRDGGGTSNVLIRRAARSTGPRSSPGPRRVRSARCSS